MQEIWLTLRGVSPAVWSYAVETEKKVIGRRTNCAIQLLHKSISRQHAEVWLDEDTGAATVRDLGSSNGIQLNGDAVTEARLRSGDLLQLGHVMLDVGRLPTADSAAEFLLNRKTDIGIDLRTAAQTAQQQQSAIEETIEVTMEVLSEAELRVLRLLLTGQSEKQIAEALFLSPHTVHSHVKRIYQSYSVNSRPALMAHFIDVAALTPQTK